MAVPADQVAFQANIDLDLFNPTRAIQPGPAFTTDMKVEIGELIGGLWGERHDA